MVAKLCNATHAVEFVRKYKEDCQRVIDEDSLGIPVENLLGLAAKESGYGGENSRIARELNNYFSMHSPAPFEVGRSPAKGDPNVYLAHFASFYQSAKSFSRRFGVAIRGKNDPSAFAQALVCSSGCYNPGKAPGGNPEFVRLLIDVIRTVKVRLTC